MRPDPSPLHVDQGGALLVSGADRHVLSGDPVGGIAALRGAEIQGVGKGAFYAPAMGLKGEPDPVMVDGGFVLGFQVNHGDGHFVDDSEGIW